MVFILRFQTRFRDSPEVDKRDLGQGTSFVALGTKTATKVRQESADDDPVTKRFETIPRR
jgi:hypothetical protein